MTSSKNTRRTGKTGLLPMSPTGGPIRILVVDDDQAFRIAIQHLLKKLGYAVSIADGGKAALEIAAQNKDIQLLITDLIMPGMTGVELAQKLQETNPRLPVLFTSGHLGMLFTSGNPRKTTAPMGVPADSANFLRKPFSLAQLGERVRTLLVKQSDTGTDKIGD